MPRVDFLISNNRHHSEMFLPVVESLIALPNYSCRIVSFCEFRGMPSPTKTFQLNRVVLKKVLPFKLRPSPTVGLRQGPRRSRNIRILARRISWPLLSTRFSSLLRHSALVVLPNDAAFPYNKLSAQLVSSRIPFLLVQEGIRFPLPNKDEQNTYGQGGASAIAAWGASSRAYFEKQGVPRERIHLTGNPRLDSMHSHDCAPAASEIKKQWRLSNKVLLLLSNPIDDQGFCSTREKLALIRRFIVELEPLFADDEFHLVVKLHMRESEEEYRNLITDLPFARRISVMGNVPLTALFQLSRAAVVFASTAGLEALLCDLPLGVLEVPGTGFIHDYVSSGAALGLRWNTSIAQQAEDLMNARFRNRALVEAYVTQSVAERQASTQFVRRLILDLVESGSSNA